MTKNWLSGSATHSAVAAASEKTHDGRRLLFVNGNMIGGCDRTKSGECRFMFRVGKDNDQAAAELTGASPMIQGDRRMRGFHFVDADTCDGEAVAE